MINIQFMPLGKQDVTAEKILKKYWGDDPQMFFSESRKRSCDPLPHGLREIDQKEFAQSRFFVFRPIGTGWSRTELGDLHMHFMDDDSGYAFVNDYWAGTLKFYKFGCKHDFVSAEVGRCLTKYTCKTCGFSETIDSSD